MGSENRGRVAIDPNGNWQIYTQTIPQGAEALGTVSRNNGDTGALVLLRSGQYVQINNGSMRTLNQRKVKAGLDGQ